MPQGKGRRLGVLETEQIRISSLLPVCPAESTPVSRGLSLPALLSASPSASPSPNPECAFHALPQLWHWVTQLASSSSEGV